ncbi:LacI family transcriptional regulator [Mycolicibacterium smegmatis]|uniref:LacI family DNA-binding transcriptional regulator n=1 Tax=Mycolicibacterium smegmatis TaxID=1772 RepID=UPI0005D87293|nr:LacI family DNA-binding transcriptional regulator [Mycolicibacterium smegmatis]MDF1899666.1 LacI family DNA-binding transcriptional regulator [Mycolicibacterium smegmatis]MDF1905454.1 LacI family DNA-binding transcriptional regulator [Mycolicibacterium smegmatis]MDF1917947.1 LacI family DNA-binding transcriptional regulator [Mycolicibacterium smegmatis]MDF1924497.1 LacI family DNA-binding transcriptional regulator [Mycolicibacterium smegmatis]UAK57765.1 LacI family transcriptional regulator
MSAEVPSRRQRSTRVSAADVARAVGVSPATVSYVMNGRAGVSEQTRARILEVAEALGHISSARADRLRSHQTRVIGLILTDIANPFYTEIAAGTIDAARARGYEVFLAHTQEDPQTLRSIVDTMIARQVDGVVITVLHPDDGEVIRSLRSARIPLVQLSRRIQRVDADFVGIDDRAAASEMMEHVVTHGYQDIVTVVGPRSSSASAAREEGFIRTAEAHGIRTVSSQRISTYLSERGGYEAVEQVLARKSLPRVIVCGSDVIALGAISALRERSLNVPDDVAVTGFDGLYPGPLVELTTINQPRREMAEQSIELLTRRIEGAGGSYQSVLRAHQLRIGTTCGCPRMRPHLAA